MPTISTTTVTHVYSCGHHEVECVSEDFGGVQHVFTDGFCTKPICPAYGRLDCTRPSSATLNRCSDLENELIEMEGEVSEQVETYANLRSSLTWTEEALKCRPILSCLESEDPGTAVREYLALPTLDVLFSRMQDFIEDKRCHAFFRFCFVEINTLIRQARQGLTALRGLIQVLQVPAAYPELFASLVVALRWPDSSVDYEPQFGVQELQALTTAGDEGLELLSSTFDESLLFDAATVIKNTNNRTSMQPTKPCMMKRQSICSIDAMLDREEALFKAEQALGSQLRLRVRGTNATSGFKAHRQASRCHKNRTPRHLRLEIRSRSLGS